MIGSGTNPGQLTYNVGGFAAGLDRMVAPGLSVGVTAGYTTGTQWTQGFSGQGSTDTFLAGLYGNYRMDKVYADAVLGYGYSYNQMWRQIFIPGLQPRTAQGGAGANQWYGQIEGGYRFDIGHFNVSAPAAAYITPFVRLQGYTGTQNGFTETGAQSLNLTVAGQTTSSLPIGDRRPARCRDRPRLAREAGAAGPAGLEPRVCRHGTAGDGNSRWGAADAVHDLWRGADARRRGGGLLGQHRGGGRRRRSISAMTATSPARTAPMRSPPACA